MLMRRYDSERERDIARCFRLTCDALTLLLTAAHCGHHNSLYVSLNHNRLVTLHSRLTRVARSGYVDAD